MKNPGSSLLLSLLAFVLLASCSSKQQQEEKSQPAEDQQLQQQIQYLKDKLDNTVNILETPETGEEFIAKSVQYAEAHPKDTASAVLYFEAANVANSLRQYRRAVELWGKVWQLYPETEVAPHALFRQGFTCDNSIRDRHLARHYYELFIQKYPAHEYVSGIRDLLQVIDRDPEDMVKQFEKQNQEGK